jgi:hypothetical protein
MTAWMNAPNAEVSVPNKTAEFPESDADYLVISSADGKLVLALCH